MLIWKQQETQVQMDQRIRKEFEIYSFPFIVPLIYIGYIIFK